MKSKVAHQIYTQEYLNSLPQDDPRRESWLGCNPKAEAERQELEWLLEFGKQQGLLNRQLKNQLKDNDYRQCISAFNELRVAAFLDKRFPSKLSPRPAGKGRKIGEYELELSQPIFIEVKSLFEDFKWEWEEIDSGIRVGKPQRVRLPERFQGKADNAEGKFPEGSLCMTIFCRCSLPDRSVDMSERAILYFLFSYPKLPVEDLHTGKEFYKWEGYFQPEQHPKVSALAIYNIDPQTDSFDGSLAVYHNPFAKAENQIDYSLLRKKGIRQFVRLDSENFGWLD